MVRMVLDSAVVVAGQYDSGHAECKSGSPPLPTLRWLDAQPFLPLREGLVVRKWMLIFPLPTKRWCDREDAF
jgi:hypothetical protein